MRIQYKNINWRVGRGGYFQYFLHFQILPDGAFMGGFDSRPNSDEKFPFFRTNAPARLLYL
jgi:hypothetical protein